MGMVWTYARHNDAALSIGSLETPFSSQLMTQTGIWKGAAFRCRFQGLPAHRSIGEIKTASVSASYTSGLTRRLRKFHLCLCIKIPPHQTHPPPPRIHPPASSALPGIRLTGESFLTGPEARSDERHNHGCSDGRIVCLPMLKTPPLDSLPACRHRPLPSCCMVLLTGSHVYEAESIPD